MSYSADDISADLLHSWEGDDIFVVKYWPKRSPEADDTTRLVLDFKKGARESSELAASLVLAALGRFELRLRDQLRCRAIISIPSHSKGVSNRPGERLCERVASAISWLDHYEGALVRTETVPKSAWAPRGERPGEEDHYRSIEYRGPTSSLRRSSIIMFDDVITRKATSAACRRIVQEATGCRKVIGVYLGRTM
jgi:predicted amidophosphoribosyltransferase